MCEVPPIGEIFPSARRARMKIPKIFNLLENMLLLNG
jgi:hypothetical protein